jgi:phosphate starvation-inducible PhoH-like protein
MNTVKDIPGIGFVEFDRSDIVRHELVKHIVDAFDRQDKIEEQRRREAREARESETK